MLNQIVLVGRLARDIEVKESESGKRVANILLAIPRSFKNIDGGYDTDFIDCVAFDSIAQNTAEYCHKGDIIGVKGRLQSTNYEKEDGSKQNRISTVAEKVTFLSTSRKEPEAERE